MNLPASLLELPTPALLLDRSVLERNLRAMSQRAHRLGVDLRPHLKTAKCHEIARRATRGHSGGITVSTLREAEYFAARGWKDLIYAVTIAPDKLSRVEALQGLHSAVVSLLTDDLFVTQALADRVGATGGRFSLFIEIDSGYHRSGVPADSELLITLARTIDGAEGLHLRGVLTHAGHSYGAEGPALAEIAEEERRAAVEAAVRLEDAGIPCPVVSVGSTPTALSARSLEGVSEIRPGNYMFFDLSMCSRGLCELEDIAVSVLATVIAHQRREGHALVDAGALALSKDLSANRGGYRGVGYGLVPRSVPIPELILPSVSQEQGKLRTRDGGPFPFDRLPIGSRVRLVPNHSCLTCAAYDRYAVVEDDRVIDVWERENGW